jgi:hypothetical protein
MPEPMAARAKRAQVLHLIASAVLRLDDVIDAQPLG